MPRQGDAGAPPVCHWCGDWPALWSLRSFAVCCDCLAARWQPGDVVGPVSFDEEGDDA